MSLSDVSIRRPVTIFMLVCIVLILGSVSLSRLNVDLLPSIELPISVVSTQYSGAGPKEVESIVTKNIENVMATVNNVKSIRSISSEGSSLVILEFNYGTDMNFATLNMREKLDLIKGMFPDGVSNPMVIKLDPNMLPIMALGVSEEGKAPSQLKTWVDETLKPRLERIEGVASISIYGGSQDEIKVIVDPDKLASNGVAMNTIINAIRMENISAPGGIISDGSYDLLVRTTGTFTSIDDIKKLPITNGQGSMFLLGDLASIEESTANQKQYSKINGKDSLSISIQKESGANTVRVAKMLNKELKNIRSEYGDVNITTVLDQSTYINKSISTVVKNTLLGGALAILILFIFLKDFRPALVIGLSIPISIVATFILVYFSGVTLNMVSLGGLALGVGMLVDNSIVVLENIYRMRQDGYMPMEAAKQGANQVSMAIIASTLTTICVFLPIVFVQGLTAQIFREMALTVTFSLLASLIVALTLVPLLSVKLTGRMTSEKRNKTFDRLHGYYERALGRALKHRGWVVIVTILLFVSSIFMVVFEGREFFPLTDTGQIDITVKMPRGTRYEETIESMGKLEDIVSNIPEADTVYSSIGGGMMGDLASGATNDRGSITLILKPISERKRSSQDVGDEIRKKTADIPGCEVQVTDASSMMGAGVGGAVSPVSVSIKGEDLDQLKRIGNDIKDIVEGVSGTREVRSSFAEGMPELKVVIDRQKASQYGINVAVVSSTVQSYIQGTVATRYKTGGSEIDVRVQTPNKEMLDVKAMEDVIIASPLGFMVPLKEIASFEYDRGPVEIERANQTRVVTVSSSISGRALSSVMDEIQKKLEAYDIPAGYTVEFGGDVEQLNEAFSNLRLALILGIILVYMVMAAQFESFIHPFIIMFTVPLAFTGAFIGLFMRHISLSVPAYLGMIILTGIVVNNGIVLVDYINMLREEGMSRDEAVQKAAPTRLRPILMTSMTTVLGLFPLSLGIGEGAEFQMPLAVSVIGGLILSTLLTLIVVPVIYTIFDDMVSKFKRV